MAATRIELPTDISPKEYGRATQNSPSACALYESGVRSYAQLFPKTFNRAQGSTIYSEDGRAYIDFLSGCGSVNYGHNNPALKQAFIEYVDGNGIALGLDFETAAKNRFLETFQELILGPRGLDYAVQFPGPTGTNAIEAALKIARMTTGRETVVAFTNGFHGVTLGALAATANHYYRDAAGIRLSGVYHAPYDGYLGPDTDTALILEKLLDDPSGGIGRPAAILLETVQGEGGLNTASTKWLQDIATLCRARKILLIVDDIQAGCGRTGKFFSFEEAGIQPDIVTLSKSIGGFGLPFALTLLRRDLDFWKPGQHNGTFRGNNLAFVTGEKALDLYWRDDDFSDSIGTKAGTLKAGLHAIAANAPERLIGMKGRGLVQGIECRDGGIARAIVRQAFERGLILETSGNRDQVVKCMPALTIDDETLATGLSILADATREAG